MCNNAGPLILSIQVNKYAIVGRENKEKRESERGKSDPKSIFARYCDLRKDFYFFFPDVHTALSIIYADSTLDMNYIQAYLVAIDIPVCKSTCV